MFFTWLQYQEQINTVAQSGLVHFLLALILVDILTGILKSLKKETTSSIISLFGILKHLLVFILTLVISIYLPLFGYEIATDFFIGYMIISYAISIIENWVLLDLPMPKFIVNRLIKIKDQMDSEEYLKQRKEEDDD